jgi:hypothetical protein
MNSSFHSRIAILLFEALALIIFVRFGEQSVVFVWSRDLLCNKALLCMSMELEGELEGKAGVKTSFERHGWFSNMEY